MTNTQMRSNLKLLTGSSWAKTLKLMVILVSQWTFKPRKVGTFTTGSRRTIPNMILIKCTFWKNLLSVMVNSLKWQVNLKELNVVIKTVNVLETELTLGVAMEILSAPVIFSSMLKINQQQKLFYVILMKEKW